MGWGLKLTALSCTCGKAIHAGREGSSTCSSFCDEAPGREAALRQGFLHDLQRHPVFHTAPRIQHLRLGQNLQSNLMCLAMAHLAPPVFTISALARICSACLNSGH